MSTAVTIGEYLIGRLRELGVEHVFGVPGDFVLDFMHLMEQQNWPLINTCDEQGAGFAADAYARLRGLGVVCVTYGVGGFKVANTTAQAFAERSPVVVLSGAPGVGERRRHPLIHHKVRDFETQRRVFDELTVASCVLDEPETAISEVERVLAAARRFKRPVYIELPRDRVHARARHHHSPRRPREGSDAEALAAALAEVTERLRAAQRPVIILGEEVHRFGLQDKLVALMHQTGLPAAATILGKSVIDEDEPLYLGIYQGGIGREEVREYVESADLVLLLGVMMTDLNLGAYTARLDRAHCVHLVAEKLSVGHHIYEEVQFDDFIAGLIAAELPTWSHLPVPPAAPQPAWQVTDPVAPITSARLFERLDSLLTETTVVIADPGDALFGSADLTVHRDAGFISPAYYASLGFAVPAAIGAQLAAPHLRPLVLVGDGAFQMTGLELSTIARYGLNPIVIVLNNHGYSTERFILDGPFNDVLDWHYHRVPDLLGVGRGHRVATEGELEAALAAALAEDGSYHLIEVLLEPLDASPALRRLGAGLRSRR